jgi:hypothetical protein
MNRYCRAAPVALASLFLAVPRSWTQPVTSPEILSAVVTTATNQLSIEGRGFSPHGTPPSVALAGTNLATVSYTDQTAVVSLPPALAAGSYSLRLKNGEGHIGVFTAIIGAGGAAILSGTCASLLGEGQSGASQGAIGLAGINTYCFSGTTQPIDPDAPGNALPIPSAGTLNNFTLVGYFTDLGVPVPSIEYSLSVTVNGTATNLACTVTMPAGSSGGPFTCADQADTVAVNAGDKVSVIVTPSSSTIPGLVLTVSLEKH